MQDSERYSQRQQLQYKNLQGATNGTVGPSGGDTLANTGTQTRNEFASGRTVRGRSVFQRWRRIIRFSALCE